MEPNLILQTATWLLAIAGLGGLVMAAIRLGGTANPPLPLAMFHGFLSAAALALLIYAGFTFGVPRMTWLAVVLFLIAAAAGVYINLTFHWRALPLPIWLILVHTVLASLGFMALLAAAWDASHNV